MGGDHAAVGRNSRQAVTAEMIDVVFKISGVTLPAAYPFALWSELSRLAPQLGENENIGVIPLRMAESKEGMLLNKRAKLVLRLPLGFADAAINLTNTQLNVAGSELNVGSCKTREIQHYSTLHAHLVTGAEDEIEFMTEVEAALAAMGVKANLICGRRHQLADGDRVIRGYSLVLHDLTPEGSLRVQYAGLGKERRFGCGIFVPYKVISSFE